MHYIQLLYQPKEHQKIFNYLRQAFGQNATEVQVDEIIEDSMAVVRWTDLLDPNELAAKMTIELPDVMIECETNNGIDLQSRYFNGSQLW